jgi:single-strand DNA-binding protein
MKDLNKIILIGRLGADPTLRTTKTGTNVTNFPLATSRRILRDENDVEEKKPEIETVWHKVYVWGRQGDNCAKYLKKGQSVYVEGSMRSRSYIGKDGISRMSFEVHAETVGFLSGGKKEAGFEEGEQAAEAS